MGTTLEGNLSGQAVFAADQGNLPLASSVLGALVYADLFDAPLSLEELRKYQISSSYSVEQIGEALSRDIGLAALVNTNGAYYCLRGREALFSLREERAAASARVWRRARLYSRWLSRLPFVQMVAVTGALAVNNLNGRDDIDLLIVSRRDRVWLCRRGLIGWVRLGRLLGDDLCPNYILSEESLELSQRDFFTAHELAQMVPVFGGKVYQQMLRANEWARVYLPALAPVAEAVDHRRGSAPGPGLLERVLRKSAFDGWERWELDRLRRKLRAEARHDAEVVLTAQQCKGHTGLHRAAVMTRYTSRLAEMGLHDVIAALEEAKERTT